MSTRNSLQCVVSCSCGKIQTIKIKITIMQKELLEIFVNGKTQDCVISHFMKAVKGENGKPIYTNINDGIAKVKGEVYDILLYVKDDNDYNKVSIVKLAPYGIKQLYAVIKEIEQKTGEEFIDD